MVKKLCLLFSCIFVLTLTAGSALAAISYCKDILEPGNSGGWGSSSKTFEDTWALNPGETVDLDIWINDVSEELLTAGCFITYDPALVNITSIVPYDTDNGGPWDAGLTTSKKIEAGQWLLVLGDLGCQALDGDGDIILGKATFECLASGDSEITVATIGDFDTVAGCGGTIYDSQITPNTFTFNKGNGTSTTTTGPNTTTTPPTSTTAPSTTTSTEPSSSSWQSSYAKMWGSDKETKLSLLRSFRDEVIARNEVVRNYVSLLYQNSSEIAGLLIKHPVLCLETRKLVEVLLPSVEYFFKTETLTLTATQEDIVESFLNQFETQVSPKLKGIIQNFRKDLRDGRLFVTVS